MKSSKLKLFSCFLACALLLLILSFNIHPRAETQMADSSLSQNTVLVGQDSTSKFNLSIGLAVLYDTDTDTYFVTATAEWQKTGLFTKMEKCAENKCFDYIVLTWGGALRANDDNIYGQYRNGREIDFSTRKKDLYGQVVWQFNEKSKRSQMSFAKVTFNLEKTEADIGKIAIVRLTYIHTYQLTKAAVPIIFGRGLAADRTSFSISEEHWQIEIDVPGIMY